MENISDTDKELFNNILYKRLTEINKNDNIIKSVNTNQKHEIENTYENDLLIFHIDFEINEKYMNYLLDGYSYTKQFKKIMNKFFKIIDQRNYEINDFDICKVNNNILTFELRLNNLDN